MGDGKAKTRPLSTGAATLDGGERRRVEEACPGERRGDEPRKSLGRFIRRNLPGRALQSSAVRRFRQLSEGLAPSPAHGPQAYPLGALVAMQDTGRHS